MGCPCATQTANTQHLNHVKRKILWSPLSRFGMHVDLSWTPNLETKCVCVRVDFLWPLGKYLLICELQKGVKGRIFPSGIPAYSEVESDQPSLVTNVTSHKGSAIERPTIQLSRSNETNGTKRWIHESKQKRDKCWKGGSVVGSTWSCCAVQFMFWTFDMTKSRLPFQSHTLHLLGVGMEHLQTKGTTPKMMSVPTSNCGE